MGSVAAQGGSLLCAVLVARILGKAVYGQFALILSTAVAITSVGGLGLGYTATKYVSEYRSSDPGKVGRILGLSSATAILTAALFALGIAVFASSLVPGEGGNAPVIQGLQWIAIYVFFTTVNGCQVGAMAGFEAFGTVATISAVYGAATVALTGILSVGYGLRGAVAAQGCAAFLLWLLYRNALRRECRRRGIAVSYGNGWQERGVFVHFSIPSAACGIVAATAVWICNSTLVRVSGYAELAVFTAVYSLRSVVIFIPSLIGRVTMPLLNNLSAGGHWTAYRRTFWGTVALNGGIALVLAMCLFLGGPQALRVFGKDFAATPVLFAMVLGAVVLEAVASTLFQALFTAGRIWRNLGVNAVWAGVLILCVTLAAEFGAAGVAFSYLMASAASLLLYASAAVKQCGEGRECAASERDHS